MSSDAHFDTFTILLPPVRIAGVGCFEVGNVFAVCFWFQPDCFLWRSLVGFLQLTPPGNDPLLQLVASREQNGYTGG
ncbi:hypothetical protein ASPWEDRAFT_218915 [Aspergillus wentii DTO 134E9]|uniref:Uncharacterized protein n=1 Tax=Aspergillus wentii DTO 134E9 TaxID=1073089 RepID=A0A1L9S008_ASPWE|nr:uncharacterized protein ASPWEDRAFT_218915 [Aspergillus wentii DTO 134E9]OJJ40520.1 hypothetical protein ASPWEDRAFT_218915 [Aspergillus wentii DTO 134E9]